MAGYTRQSVASIINGANITAPPLNAEFNQLLAAFSGSTGHGHTGGSGDAPKIPLATSVSGYLLPANGGVGGLNNTTATANPVVGDDGADGYAPGSIWLNTNGQKLFVNLNNSSGAAVWSQFVVNNALNQILPHTDNTVDLGSSSFEFKDLYIDGTAYVDSLNADAASVGTTLGVTGAVTFGSTAAITGNTTIGGTLGVTGATTLSNNLTVSGTTTVAGATTLNGNTTIGNASSDTVTVTAQVSSDLVPSSDNARDLGSSSKEWKDLYIDGTANIDSLVADTADINGGSIDGTVIGGAVQTSGQFSSVTSTNLTASGAISFAAATISNLGTVNTANIDGGTIDGVTLGVSSPITNAQIDNININGSAITSTNTNGNISITPNGSGEVDISKVDIDSGTIDNTSIGATTASTGLFTTVGTSGLATLASVDVNGGNIDGTVIGNSTPQAITGTTITANSGFVGGVTGNVTGNLTGNVTGNVTGNLTGDITGNITASSGASTFNNVTVNGTLDVTGTTIANVTDPSSAQDAATKNYVDTADALKANINSPSLTGTPLAPTAAASTNTTQIATTAFVSTAVSNLVDSAPGTLDTLNELAAALGDDPDFATTITDSIATKLPLAGGTMTGNITLAGAPSANLHPSTKLYTDTADALKLNLSGGTMSGAIAMGTSKITGMGDPTSNQDAATKVYTDTQRDTRLALSGGTMSGAIAMGTNKITGAGDPTSAQDVATKNYIDSLFGSTSAAATSASAAATSATASASSATASASSATASASSATAAAASYDQFDDRYLGSKSSAPTVDNDGDALVIGALYFDTTSNSMKVYSSGGWVSAGSSVNGTSNRFDYVVGTNSGSYTDSSTTTFPATYDAGYVDVYLNGVKLVVGTDVTATSGTNVVLASAAATGDNICIVGYGTFQLANFSVGEANDVDLTGNANNAILAFDTTDSRFEPTLTPTLTSLTTTGNVSVGGNLDVTGSFDMSDANITNIGSIALDTITDDGGTITLDSSGSIVLDADSGDVNFKDGGVETLRYSSSASGPQFFSPVADKDIIFKGNDNSSTITALTLDMSDGGTAQFNKEIDLLQSNHIRWKHAAGGTIRASIDADSNDSLMFYTGSSETKRVSIDNVGRLLIGTDSGDSFNSDAMLRLQRSGDRVFQQFKVDADQEAAIFFGDVDDDVECGIRYEPANKNLIFSTGNNADALTINDSQKVQIGGTAANFGVLNVTGPSNGDATIDLYSSSGSGSEGKSEIFFSSDKSGGDHQSMASIVMEQGSGDGGARKGQIRLLVADNGGPSTALTIANNKQVTTAGDLIVGADIQMSSGRGIAFTSTTPDGPNVISETLDDYEEGDWTPANNGTAFATAYGTYTKIGNRVFCQMYVLQGSGGSSTGDWSGLPFTIRNDVGKGRGGGAVSYHNENTSESWQISCENLNSTTFSLRRGSSQKQLTAGKQLWGAFSYLV
jgi:hypothetical protein